MSSSTYSTCLTPDPRLRMIVVCSGRLLCVAGCVLLLTLPFDIGWRFLLCACWIGSCWFELSGLQRGHADCRAMRLHQDGSIEIRNRDWEWVSAEMQRDSVVFAHLAWIRAHGGGGHRYAELLSGNARACQEWRRLQVIWRHIGAAARSC